MTPNERTHAERPSEADSSVNVANARDAEGDRYCWSHDEEEYHGDFDTREAALAEATAELEGNDEPGETRAVWTGVQRKALYFLRRRAEHIGRDFAERMDEHLGDEIAADDPVVNITDLRAFGSALLDLLERHATFGRWAVAEVQEHAVVVPGDALAAQQRKGG